MPEQRLQEEVSFPRGGGARQSSQQAEESSEQNKKRKSLQASTETDFLFGKKDDAKTSKKPKKRKASSSDAQSLLPLGGGGVVVTASKRNAKKAAAPTIEALGFSKLAKNTKVLAVVRELQNEFAVVSLPNLLTGYILPSTDYSLPSSLKLGQTLAVCVQKVVTEDVKGQATPRRRIQVSPLPLHVNVRDETMFQKKKLPVRGQMTSVEDHGCLVDLGLGRRGFLKYEDIQGKYHILGDDDEDADYVSNESKSPHILQPGRLLDFYVSSKKNQVYALQLPSKKTLVNQVVAPPATSKSAPYTLASITPGWLVNAKIEAMAKNGLCVTFLGSIFRGAIELGHLGGYHIPSSKDDNDGWKILFHKHQHFPARVVAVDVPTKLIRLTLLPHLLELKVPPPLPSVGSTIEECTVIRNDPGIGALLALPESYNFESNELSRKMLKSSDLFQHHDFTEASAVRAVYVHISKALEGEKDTNSASIFGKEFAISTKHTVRILSHGNMMDGVASGACALSILEAHVLTYGDLKAGQVYKQVPVVAQLQGGSILVQLGGDGIRALIPKDHLIDSSATNSEYRKKIMKQKFAVDAKVDVRVMWVDPLKKKCFATTKKSLVKASEDQIISSYQELKLGERATGFVSKVDNKALYITFCNRVFGKVTSRSLAAELGMENVHDNYTVGDVVTCRIVKLKKRTSRRRSYSPRNNDGESNDEDQDAQRAYWEVTLSLKVDGEDRDDAIVKDAIEEQERIDVKNPKQVQVQAGAILPMKSMKIVELIKGKRKTKGGYIPGYAIVSIKSKHLLPKSECGSMESNMECKLPYDQILDDYAAEDIESVEAFDALAESVLTVGKKINQKGIILTDPRKSNVDFLSGIGRLAIVSIRKNLIQTAESQYNSGESSSDDVILPTPNSRLFVGALLRGYVVQVDPRYGGFVRFLDGLTGIIPKKSGGLNMPLFQTVVTRVKALDDAKNQILLEPINTMDKEHQLAFPLPLNTGDKVDAIVKTVDFLLVTLDILDEMIDSDSTRVCLHCTMKESSEREVKSHPKSVSDSKDNITKGHPFYGLKPGQKLSGLSVLSAERRKGLIQVHLTDRDLEVDTSMAPIFAKNRSQLKPGTITSVIVTGVAPKNKGLYVEASPFVKGFVPGLELSKDLKVLNRIGDHVSVGSRIRCCVMDQNQWHNNRAKNTNNNKKIGQTDKSKLIFSVLACKGDVNVSKPTRGDVIVGRIQRGLPQSLSPSLMLSLRGGYVGRCCITELDENDEWENMPVGRRTHAEEKKEQGMDDSMDVDDEENENDDKKKNDIDER
jgi:ribosomal protein S1